MNKNHLALGVDQVGGGHALQIHAPGQLPFGIKSQCKLGRILRQETIGIAFFSIHIDRDDLNVLALQLGLHVVHEGEGLTTRHTPRGPKVQIYPFAFEVGELWGRAVTRDLQLTHPLPQLNGLGAEGAQQEHESKKRKFREQFVHAKKDQKKSNVKWTLNAAHSARVCSPYKPNHFAESPWP